MSFADFRLDGRVAIVTGGAAGIGAGIATLLADAGATLVVADRDLAGATATADAIGGQALAIDVADEGSVVAGLGDVVARFGTPWALVNNAGVQDRELLVDTTIAHWERTMAVNARGALIAMREAARAMIAGGGGGRIVNIASAALAGGIVKGLAGYAASKGAMQAMAATAALELSPHGITVNTVLPGGVATPGAIGAAGPTVEGPGRRVPPLGRCEPGDIAGAVLYLASPAARYVTSQTIAVDAGFSVSV